jgi:hypothetical protein
VSDHLATRQVRRWGKGKRLYQFWILDFGFCEKFERRLPALKAFQDGLGAFAKRLYPKAQIILTIPIWLKAQIITFTIPPSP